MKLLLGSKNHFYLMEIKIKYYRKKEYVHLCKKAVRIQLT